MIVVIDQGTTSSKLLLVNSKTEILYKDSIEISIKRKVNGEILQNGEEILASVNKLLSRLFERKSVNPKDIKAISLTNQRETTLVWDKDGNLLSDAISWQANHTSYITDKWIEKDLRNVIAEKTGLIVNPYFSASKIKHLLNKLNLNKKDLYFGTVDTFLLYNLTKEKNYVTDITNASRTMLYNIKSLKWDNELLKLFELENINLPKVLNNDDLFGHLEVDDTLIPFIGVIGDQQASLFGNLCSNFGDTKITYGTGSFILTNTLDKLMYSNYGLLSTIAWKVGGNINYALEGSVFMGGAAISWMKDKFNFIASPSDTEKMALESNDDSVYVVPAFSGLGAPHWNDKIKASILGLKASSSKADIIKATLNSIAFQVTDILKVMQTDNNIKISQISVDGGASKNNYLMQFQSDLINAKLIKFKESELTSLGAAFIAGLKTKVWTNVSEIKKLQSIQKLFIPTKDRKDIENKYARWQKAIKVTSIFE